MTMLEHKKVIIVAHSWGGIPGSESVKAFELAGGGGDGGGVMHCLFVSAIVGCKGEILMSIIGNELPYFLSKRGMLVFFFYSILY